VSTLDECPTVRPRAAVARVVEGPHSPVPIAEEIVNLTTPAVGLVLGVAGAVVLLAWARRFGDVWYSVAVAVYAGSLVAVYAASTLSHLFQDARRRHLFRRLDQAVIFLFIAGTYTPFALVYLRTGPWSVLLALVWGIALFGFFTKVVWGRRVEAVTTRLYLFLGWLPIVAVWPLTGMVQSPGLRWMLYGGLCYTVGTVFLRIGQRMPFAHGVWHVLVIAGTAWHYFAILLCVAPID